MTELTVTPLTGTIGAEISGVDLGKPLDQGTLDAIYQVLIERLVIFFRDQDISPARHQDFAQNFGDLDAPHPVYKHVPGFDRIVMPANDASNPPDTDGWHTDVTFRQNPPFASILVARDIPPVGGDTLWSNLYAAYDALPGEMKAMLEDVTVVHDMGEFRNNFGVGEVDGTKITAAMQRFGCALHKAVQVHPVTGRKFRYCNEGFAMHVLGMTTRQSRRLLHYLFDHQDRPEYQVRFKWRAGSVAMWDNRCTTHYAVADYLPHYRCMNRVTVVNDRRAPGQATIPS